MMDSVYIHIPFCERKCGYCDFNSYAVNGQPVQQYLQALDLEIKRTVDKSKKVPIKTIYIGGGTPTILSAKEMEKLFLSIHRYFPKRDENIEFTVEANPGTLDQKKIKVMKEYGVNRISMGVQAFQDQLLSFIGRIHSVKDVYDSIEKLRNQDFHNISIDLMFGLPHQTTAMLMDSIHQATSLDLPHISAYSLKVEEGTAFYALQKKNALPLPSEDDELQMYLEACEKLKEVGMHQYEISNFAKFGFESKHNLNYWKNKSYYGFGAGAHGYRNGVRHENIKNVNQYIEALFDQQELPRKDEYEPTLREKMEDMLMLGLRLTEGVKFADFKAEFGEDLMSLYDSEIKKLVTLGLLEKNETGIKLTNKGLIFGNEVFAEFISL